MGMRKFEFNSVNRVKEAKPMEDIADQPRINSRRRYCHWLLVAMYAVFVLLGHSAATLLGRLYYEKGGKSKWMVTLVQHYLPVSTYSLIGSSELAFNAFFSFFINSMKFTPYIINSLLLLTISSTLLVFQTKTEHSTEISKKNHAIGLICTLAASAGEGLLLSVRQFAFEKVLKKETFKVIMDMIICESLVATCVILVGLFASGEWDRLHEEMEEFELGKASYLLNLIFTAINWQLYCIGCVGLVFEVSSLFSNSISALGLPIVPISAVIIFHEKMQGIKAISMVLALWGFISYLYHHYLDDRNSNTESRNDGHVPN
ncbi:PREDICTED: probable purine permease 9 isoform X2 [Lupinus angustifolius]|uniref:probable purine permease 9 isoform X2 n=1 Tax=Lupinus angustifolius TaxID=3871 RepID=UPI00092F33F0|nr:PREDICTED: probable purine permease 9 isoform X2 [Lupinus angustifolius]